MTREDELTAINDFIHAKGVTKCPNEFTDLPDLTWNPIVRLWTRGPNTSPRKTRPFTDFPGRGRPKKKTPNP